MIIAMHLGRYTQLVLLAVLLPACAPAPRYQTAYRYEAPTDAVGRACLARCDQSLRACRTDCANAYTACLQSVEPEAKAQHAEALKRYEEELRRYQHALERDHLNLSLGWGRFDDDWYSGGWYDPWPPYGYRPRHYAPAPPQPPRYEDTLEGLRTLQCRRDCACQPQHDECVLACGGTRLPQRRCIANCPPES